MSVSISSYNGRVTVGVMADAGLVPDPERMIDGFRRELDTLAQIGRTPPAAKAVRRGVK